jgi:exodeoxyribonuclease VII small subunit
MVKNQENPKSLAETIPFEQALKELEAIVRKLEGGSGDLEASINDYVRGTELKDYCQKKLAAAKLKVESILKMPDGSIATKPFDEEQ